MNMKMDLTEKGLLMFFKEYQIEALEAIWGSDTGMSSREVWEAVGENSISRASVINFLEDAVENGLIEKHEVTGKGGHRGIYSSSKDKQATKEYLQTIFKNRLEDL
jgi:predicted transcriptional regulator